MRISDWSSDVCSSDLVRAVGLVGAHAAAMKARRRADAVGLQRRGVDDHRPAHAIAGGADLALRVDLRLRVEKGEMRLRVGLDDRLGKLLEIAEQFQIGSASCRESVCQYV